MRGGGVGVGLGWVAGLVGGRGFFVFGRVGFWEMGVPG